jgi:hypothetical protein
VTIITEQFRYIKATHSRVIRDEHCILLNKHGLIHSAVHSKHQQMHPWYILVGP